MDTTIPMSRARTLRAYLLETRYEFLRLLRTPQFALPTILFPALFYVFFGVVLNHASHGFDPAAYMLADFAAFGALSPGLFGFGVAVAMEREQGLLTLKRALPMPPGAYLVAKMLMAILFAALVTLLLMLLAAIVGHVRMPGGDWIVLLVTCAFGVLPFCAIGLFIGTLVGGQGAPAVVNLVYLPMSILSGLWLPIFLLPKILQQTAPFWPAYHLGQLALRVIGQSSVGTVAEHAAVLAVYTIVFFWLAERRMTRVNLNPARP